MSDRTVWTLSEQIGAYGDPVTLCVCGSPGAARRRANEIRRLTSQDEIVWRASYPDGSQAGESRSRERSGITVYYWLAPLPFYEEEE